MPHHPDLYLTLDKVRDFDSIGPGMYTKNSMEPALNDIDLQSHSTVVNAINMQMQMPLESTAYQSSATQDNTMKDASSG